MQGMATKTQKDIARQMGYDPDGVYDPATGKYIPLEEGLVAPAAIFTNQGVPMTRSKYGPPIIGSSEIESHPEGSVDFNHPTPRNEFNNAPIPGRKGDPYAGKSAGGG
jgi:hypothetical protein